MLVTAKIPNCVKNASMARETPRKRHWLEDALTDRGFTRRELAQHLGLQPPRITEMIKGERQIKPDEIAGIADFLGIPRTLVLDLATNRDQTFRLQPIAGKRPILKKGRVAAGVWLEQWELPVDEQEPIYAPAPSDKYPGLYALVVEGPSMNQRFPEGTTLIVAPFREYSGPLQTGLYVICQRQRGVEFETTVKELVIEDERYWLWPRSTHPDFQQPLEVGSPSDWHEEFDTDVEIVIIGVVVAVYQDVLPAN